MLKKTLSMTLALLMLACVCWAAAVPGYTAKVVGKMGTMKLSIDCVIQQKVDSDTLKTLGEKVYNEHDGKGFERVFINWYLPHYKIGAGAWGITNFENGKISVQILSLQG